MNKELHNRAAACKHWRWMNGMLAYHRWTGPNIRVVTCDGKPGRKSMNQSHKTDRVYYALSLDKLSWLHHLCRMNAR